MSNLNHLLLSVLAHHVSGNQVYDIGDYQSAFIRNAGFETDFYPIVDNTYHYTLPGEEIPIVTGWERYNPSNIDVDYDIGITNPTGGTSIDDPVFKDGVPEGHQCVFIDQWYKSLRDLGEIGLEQKLKYKVYADTTYILSVWVGNAASNEWSNSSDEAGFWNYTGFPGYKVELIAYEILDDGYIFEISETILAQDDNSLSIGEGIWKQSIVTVTIADGDPNIGETLGIRIINKNIDNGYKYGMDVFFDDVRLEEEREGEEEEEEGEGDLKAGESGKKKKSSAGIIIVVILLILVVFCVIGVIVYNKNKSKGRAYVPDNAVDMDEFA